MAGNIAFGLGCLGRNPLLVGSVGADFAGDRSWLDDHGVDTSGVRTSAIKHTARFIATNDTVGNQIASFYPGAMSEDSEIDIVGLVDANGMELVLIGAGDPAAMQRYTATAGRRASRSPRTSPSRWPSSTATRCRLVEGAAYLFSNEYEEAVIESKTGWSSADVLERVGTRIVTLGADGAKVERKGEEPVVVGPVNDAKFVEPTGAGDAFRSGFLAATAWGLSTERAIQLGNLIAVHVLETSARRSTT